MTQHWRLDTPSQTFVLAAADDQLPEVVYWSAPLSTKMDLVQLTGRTPPAFGGGVLDCVQPLSVCPNSRDGFSALPGMEVRNAQGVAVQYRLRLVRAELAENALTLEYGDEDAGLDYRLIADAKADVILLSAQAQVRDGSIAWLAAPVLPTGPEVNSVLEFSGRWCGEFQPHRSALQPGVRMRENRLGRSSHEHFPGLFLLAPGTTETGARNAATAGPLVLSRSGSGLNGVSQAYHDYLRAHVLRFSDPARPRPVHYNCWEAVYFNHNLTKLSQLADLAADLGVERLVLDDGWFGARDDDSSSLGDWWVNPAKWPDGLGPLIDHVKTRGMSFGLWFEPEMVNEDSDLFRAHPDWRLGPADQVAGRRQYVLDLGKPEVVDYLFEAISKVLSAHDIDYIKWDHNRVLPFPDPGQAEGLYTLLHRLRTAHPGTEIESCASGGGRTGRTLPMSHRAAVAGARAMGLEMDLAELTEDEYARVKLEIAAFKSRRGLIHTGRLYRLESNDEQVLAEIHVAQDRGGFVLFAGQLQPSQATMARPLRLAGLYPNKRYRIWLENPGDVPGVLNRGQASPFRRGRPVVMLGQVLMQAGLHLPNAFPDTVWTVTGEML